MDLQLKGKTALITGSTAGIGLATARALAAEGVNVVVNGRTAARVDAVIAQLGSDFPAISALGVAADLVDRSGTDRVIECAPTVDIVVNNLGIYGPKPFAEISDEEWMRIIQVNFMSGVRLCQHYLPAMQRRNWGRILFVSSESALDIPAEMIHYGVTKTMQIALGRGLSKLCAGTGVTVNSVLAGPTFSEGVSDFISGIARERGIEPAQVEREFFGSLRPNSLIRRFATVEEIASFVVYLASPLAAATTGAALRADGGIVNSIV